MFFFSAFGETLAGVFLWFFHKKEQRRVYFPRLFCFNVELPSRISL